ncbi:MAG: hypothetical protein FWD60_09915 [Candidatus Azobacteroides sp.]|nr:hypothetical protein [Candidatus Azobacteroides sp.]
MKKTFLFLATLCFLAFANKAVGQTVNFGKTSASMKIKISKNAEKHNLIFILFFNML